MGSMPESKSPVDFFRTSEASECPPLLLLLVVAGALGRATVFSGGGKGERN